MTTIVAATGMAVLVLLAGNVPWAGFGPVGSIDATLVGGAQAHT